MNPQVQKALDGDSSVQSLDSSQRAELAAAEAQIDAVLRAVPVEPLPDLAPAVLERIRRESSRARAPIAATPISAAPRRNSTNWLWRPHSISITWRPAYAFAAAAVFMEIGPAERTGHYRTTGEQMLFDAKGKSFISFEDYAVAVLDELEQPQHVSQRFGVAY